MSHNESAERLIHAGDGLVPYGRELQDRLQPFTVPIFRFKSAPTPEDCGSGVLLRICDRYFVLTAAHCLTGEFASQAMGVRGYVHRFKFEPLRRSYVQSARGDFGYYELSSESASTIEAGNRAFLSEKSVEVLSVAEHFAASDFLALGGYPLGQMDHIDGGTEVKLLVYSTTMAGGEHAPPSNVPRELAHHRREIHMWIPQQGNVNVLSESPTSATLCGFKGASGGGWWSTHLNRQPWRPSDVKLIGTHVSSSKKETILDGLRHKFSVVSLVGNHLALMAKDDHSIRDQILETWPAVQEYIAGLWGQ